MAAFVAHALPIAPLVSVGPVLQTARSAGECRVPTFSNTETPLVSQGASMRSLMVIMMTVREL